MMMNRSQRACLPTALDNFDASNDIIFTELRRAVLEDKGLHVIAATIMEGRAARVRSLHKGLVLFDGRVYVPTASPLLPDLLQVLCSGGPANME